MEPDFELVFSPKKGITSAQSFIITRGRTLYLRIVGSFPNYRVLTPTAPDDARHYSLPDKVRLMYAALKWGDELQTQTSHASDWAKREYISVGGFTITPGQDEETNAQLAAIFQRFFEIFDSYDPSQRQQMDEMREIYHSMAPDDSGEDVYLSDGVWLSANGRLHDSGR